MTREWEAEKKRRRKSKIGSRIAFCEVLSRLIWIEQLLFARISIKRETQWKYRRRRECEMQNRDGRQKQRTVNKQSRPSPQKANQLFFVLFCVDVDGSLLILFNVNYLFTRNNDQCTTECLGQCEQTQQKETNLWTSNFVHYLVLYTRHLKICMSVNCRLILFCKAQKRHWERRIDSNCSALCFWHVVFVFSMKYRSDCAVNASLEYIWGSVLRSLLLLFIASRAGALSPALLGLFIECLMAVT